MYSALTYDIMKSYLTRVRDKKIRNGSLAVLHWKQGLLCDKARSFNVSVWVEKVNCITRI